MARGSEDSSARRSTSIVSTPSRASEMAAASPAGPAPAMTHRRLFGRAWSLFISSDIVSFIRHHVERICCDDGHTALRAASARADGRGDAPARARRRVRPAARGAGPAGERRPDRAHGRRRAIDRLRDLRLPRRALRRARRRPARARRLPAACSRRSPIPTRACTCATGSPAACTPSPPTATSIRALVSMAALDPEAVGGAMQRMRAAAGQGHDAAGAAAGRARAAARGPHGRGRPPTGCGS